MKSNVFKIIMEIALFVQIDFHIESIVSRLIIKSVFSLLLFFSCLFSKIRHHSILNSMVTDLYKISIFSKSPRLNFIKTA